MTVAVTVSVTSDDDGGSEPTGNTFGLASADDKGPVNVITEDPTCAAWAPINDTFAAVQKRGWNERDPALPAADWTPAQRTQYDEVAHAARDAADQAVALIKVTPHRVMRELYEQFVAYARAYSDAVPEYIPDDDHLARVFTSTGAALVYVCAAIEYDAAAARAPLVDSTAPPSVLAPLTNPSDPERFLLDPDPVCEKWNRVLTQFNTDTKDWQALDSGISASNWNPAQRAVVDAVVPVMTEFADEIEDLGRSTSNPVFQDLAVLSAQYRRAYAAALPTYTPADSYLTSVSRHAASAIYEACKAAGA
ncbi:hypothetical protein [Mycolicibacterium pulveris]|uniref:hypothetical protein n=1 Tax=Mycolicibacterium pulveris TaxID=36813 RepID=UPI003CF9CA6A